VDDAAELEEEASELDVSVFVEEDAGCEELELDPPHTTTESDMAAAIAIAANFFFIMGSSLWKINRCYILYT
jgi:hypothetical protein